MSANKDYETLIQDSENFRRTRLEGTFRSQEINELLKVEAIIYKLKQQHGPVLSTITDRNSHEAAVTIMEHDGVMGYLRYIRGGIGIAGGLDIRPIETGEFDALMEKFGKHAPKIDAFIKALVTQSDKKNQLLSGKHENHFTRR